MGFGVICVERVFQEVVGFEGNALECFGGVAGVIYWCCLLLY